MEINIDITLEELESVVRGMSSENRILLIRMLRKLAAEDEGRKDNE